MKEKCLDPSEDIDLLTYVCKIKERLSDACKLASDNLEKAQGDMKLWYDRNARKRQFQVGDHVLVLMPMPGSPLQARFIGPCKVLKRSGDLNYVVSTPERRKKTQLCHVNMLKPYYSKKCGVAVVHSSSTDSSVEQTNEGPADFDVPVGPAKLSNSKVLNDLDSKLSHLSTEKRSEMSDLINNFTPLFPDVPRKAKDVEHDVDVGDAAPIKQHPYRVGQEKMKAMADEIEYMLKNDIIETAQVWTHSESCQE